MRCRASLVRVRPTRRRPATSGDVHGTRSSAEVVELPTFLAGCAGLIWTGRAASMHARDGMGRRTKTPEEIDDHRGARDRRHQLRPGLTEPHHVAHQRRQHSEQRAEHLVDVLVRPQRGVPLGSERPTREVVGQQRDQRAQGREEHRTTAPGPTDPRNERGNDREARADGRCHEERVQAIRTRSARVDHVPAAQQLVEHEHGQHREHRQETGHQPDGREHAHQHREGNEPAACPRMSGRALLTAEDREAERHRDHAASHVQRDVEAVRRNGHRLGGHGQVGNGPPSSSARISSRCSSSIGGGRS